MFSSSCATAVSLVSLFVSQLTQIGEGVDNESDGGPVRSGGLERTEHRQAPLEVTARRVEIAALAGDEAEAFERSADVVRRPHALEDPQAALLELKRRLEIALHGRHTPERVERLSVGKPTCASRGVERESGQQRLQTTAAFSNVAAHAPEPEQPNGQPQAGFGVAVRLTPVECRPEIAVLTLQATDECILAYR